MGYTHRWRSKGFNDAQWSVMTIAAHALVKLCRPEGIELELDGWPQRACQDFAQAVVWKGQIADVKPQPDL